MSSISHPLFLMGEAARWTKSGSGDLSTNPHVRQYDAAVRFWDLKSCTTQMAVTADYLGKFLACEQVNESWTMNERPWVMTARPAACEDVAWKERVYSQ